MRCRCRQCSLLAQDNDLPDGLILRQWGPEHALCGPRPSCCCRGYGNKARESIFFSKQQPDKKRSRILQLISNCRATYACPLGIAVCAALAPVRKETKGMPGCLPAALRLTRKQLVSRLVLRAWQPGAIARWACAARKLMTFLRMPKFPGMSGAWCRGDMQRRYCLFGLSHSGGLAHPEKPAWQIRISKVR